MGPQDAPALPAPVSPEWDSGTTHPLLGEASLGHLVPMRPPWTKMLKNRVWNLGLASQDVSSERALPLFPSGPKIVMWSGGNQHRFTVESVLCVVPSIVPNTMLNKWSIKLSK